MAVTSGLVQYVKVGDDYGFTGVEEQATGELEVFIIWFSDTGPGGPVGFWTLQLMTAMAQGLPVDVSHADDSAYILQVQVRAP
jgi:hypothetical protein